MARNTAMFIGIGGQVVALDPSSGTELWRTKIKSHNLSTLLVEEDRVYAGVAGELFCLDAATGKVLWENKLKGLGYGIICFGGSSDAVGAAAAAQAAASSSVVT